MRVLFLASRDSSNPYNGGGDIYINELAKGYAKRGHSVTILSSSFPESRAGECIENVRVIRLGSGFTMFFRVFVYYFRHLRGQFDVVVEEVMGGQRIPFFASLYMKERVVGILHQKHQELFRHQFSLPIASLLSLFERFLVLLYKDNQLIVNSLRTREDLHGMGYRTENMHVVYPGLPDYFFQSEIYGFKFRQPRVICLTKIRRYKLIDQAICAMKKVHQVLPDSELVIAGRTNDFDPEYENEIRQLILDLGLQGSIFFEKDITEKQKISLLKSSRALVLPSALEGFGIVVIEANACGTPAIVSDRVPAAVNGKNAIITPYLDVESLSHAIISLLSDEKKWSALSANSLEWAKHFTWNETVNRFVDVIESNTKH